MTQTPYLGQFISGEVVLVSNNSANPAVPSGFTVEGVLTDPTLVEFKWSINQGTPTVWQYEVDAEVIRTGVGLYYARIDTTGLTGNVIVEWVTDPDGTDPQVCQTVAFAVFGLVAPPL